MLIFDHILNGFRSYLTSFNSVLNNLKQEFQIQAKKIDKYIQCFSNDFYGIYSCNCNNILILFKCEKFS